jgi:2-methylcitrate dehydratase PrpD
MTEQRPAALDSLTAYVADFIVATRYEAIPADVLALGKKSILDGLGLALAGSVAKSGQLLRRHLQGLGITNTSASALGTSLALAPRFAAFANGTAVHADDYDDTQLAVAKDRVYGLLTHPTAPALPSTLAVAERDKRSGRDFLTAYHVGVEVECKIAEAINPRHYQHGFHSTATCGALGAAAGVANLLGLTQEQAQTCLGIAGSLAAGLRENFGTMMKPFHAGRAAESGVIAGEFAQLGFTSTPIVLEAGRGFFRAAGGGYDEAAIRGKLGAPWTFATPGVSIKPHPSGSLTHPGMTKMLELIRQHDIRPKQVASVKVGTNQNMPNALIHHRPTTELQAKFSMEFCMAILLLERKGGAERVHRRGREPTRRPGHDPEGGLRRPPRGGGSGLRQDDHHPGDRAHRRARHPGPGGLRQGQPGHPDDLRRGGGQVPRVRHLQPMAQGEGGAGRRAGAPPRGGEGRADADGPPVATRGRSGRQGEGPGAQGRGDHAHEADPVARTGGLISGTGARGDPARAPHA